MSQSQKFSDNSSSREPHVTSAQESDHVKGEPDSAQELSLSATGCDIDLTLGVVSHDFQGHGGVTEFTEDELERQRGILRQQEVLGDDSFDECASNERSQRYKSYVLKTNNDSGYASTSLQSTDLTLSSDYGDGNRCDVGSLCLGTLPLQKECIQESSEEGLDSTRSPSNKSSPESVEDPEYEQKLEFAVKLGYTEEQLQQALVKIGPHHTQNDLLAELIKLGSLARTDSEYEGATGAGSGSGGSARSTPGPLDSVPSVISGSDGSEIEFDFRSSPLRHVILDGNNVAMTYGNKERFSAQGIKIAVEWFKQRGHQEITVVLPQRVPDDKNESEILGQLEKDRMLSYVPARRMEAGRHSNHEERWLLKMAAQTDGILVSNENFRDLVNDNEDNRKLIEERILLYSFVNDRFVPPEDTLIRQGTTLDALLSREQSETHLPICPYGKKCTYGNKCKFYHPGKPHRSVTEMLAEQAKEKLQQRKEERKAHSKSTSSSLNKSRTSSTESSKSQRSPRDLSPTSSDSTSGAMTPRTARKLQKSKAILLSPTKLLPPKSKSEEGTETTGDQSNNSKKSTYKSLDECGHQESLDSMSSGSSCQGFQRASPGWMLHASANQHRLTTTATGSSDNLLVSLVVTSDTGKALSYDDIQRKYDQQKGPKPTSSNHCYAFPSELQSTVFHPNLPPPGIPPPLPIFSQPPPPIQKPTGQTWFSHFHGPIRPATSEPHLPAFGSPRTQSPSGFPRTLQTNFPPPSLLTSAVPGAGASFYDDGSCLSVAKQLSETRLDAPYGDNFSTGSGAGPAGGANSTVNPVGLLKHSMPIFNEDSQINPSQLTSHGHSPLARQVTITPSNESFIRSLSPGGDHLNISGGRRGRSVSPDVHRRPGVYFQNVTTPSVTRTVGHGNIQPGTLEQFPPPNIIRGRLQTYMDTGVRGRGHFIQSGIMRLTRQNSCSDTQLNVNFGDYSPNYNQWCNASHINVPAGKSSNHESTWGAWQESTGYRHLYQQRAPSPWAVTREPPTISVSSGTTRATSEVVHPNRTSLTDSACSNENKETGPTKIKDASEGCVDFNAEPVLGEMSPETAKEMLYNRLCGIFEEEKVKYVMSRHPEEVHPQKICSLILTYFPS